MPANTLSAPIRASDALNPPAMSISLDTLDWLVRKGHLKPFKCSPFGFLLYSKPREGLMSLTMAAEQELQANGLQFGSSKVKPSRLGAQYQESLQLLAQPQACLRISSVTPGQQPVQVTLFIKGDKACNAYFEEEALCVGTPMDLTAVSRTLINTSTTESNELEGLDVTVWPSLFRMMTLIFHDAELKRVETLTRPAALARLAKVGMNSKAATEVLEGLKEAELVKETDQGVSIHPSAHPWLELTWSGHLLELEYTSLPEGTEADLSKLAASTDRLLFVGPADQRVLCTNLTGEDLRQELKEMGYATATPPEDHLTALTALPPQVLTHTIHAFLGLER